MARRLATAGLQLAAFMITRAQVTQRFTRVKFTLFSCTSADMFVSCCDSARRRGNDLGTTIKYL
jgi:hypothetical protein